MKKLLIIFLLLVTLSGVEAQAQNFREWFKQKKTQREYLLKQLALLRVHISQIKKGVTIVQKGLTTVQHVKHGEFNLHKDFFSYLDNVNPLITNSAKVVDIIAYQLFIMQQLNSVTKYCKKNKHFTAEEVRYVADVYTNMLVLCDANLAELLTIIKPDKTKMTDDERLVRIDSLHDDMYDKHAFVKSFDNEIRYIAANRAHEQYEIEFLTKQYND